MVMRLDGVFPGGQGSPNSVRARLPTSEEVQGRASPALPQAEREARGGALLLAQEHPEEARGPPTEGEVVSAGGSAKVILETSMLICPGPRGDIAGGNCQQCPSPGRTAVTALPLSPGLQGHRGGRQGSAVLTWSEAPR